MAAYRRVAGLKSPAGRLPVHRHQLRTQRSKTINEYGRTLPLRFILDSKWVISETLFPHEKCDSNTTEAVTSGMQDTTMQNKHTEN